MRQYEAFSLTVPVDLGDEIGLGALEQARELFLSAGAERLQQELGSPWLQIGLPFERDEADAWLARELGPWVERALRDGDLDRCFFMRKSPGLRVRFRALGSPNTLLAALRKSVPESLSARAEVGPYDPEVYQFGGEVGLDVAHEFFTIGSRAWCALQALPKRDEATDTVILSLLVLHDLVLKIAQDSFEEWDIWAHLTLAGRLPTEAQARAAKLDEEYESNEALYRHVRYHRDAVLAALRPDERDVVRMCCEGNSAVVGRLLAAAASGQLLYGIRKIIPFWFIFHWNQWRLVGDDQFAMAYSMERMLSPKNEALPVG